MKDYDTYVRKPNAKWTNVSEIPTLDIITNESQSSDSNVNQTIEKTCRKLILVPENKNKSESDMNELPENMNGNKRTHSEAQLANT